MITTAGMAGLIIGNFIYQLIFGYCDWGRAVEISFFQAIAVFGVALMNRTIKGGTNGKQ